MNKVETITDDRRHLLAPFRGEKPPAPQWFEDAIAQAPERSFIDVRGAAIETLAWGERGKPGLLFLHGNGACADWWSFIAPFFADTHRVAAFSMSGMGGSGWRDTYSYDLYVDEAFAVAEATGLFASTAKPVIIGHSFGAFITAGIVGRAGATHRRRDACSTALFSAPPHASGSARCAEHRGRSVSTTRWSKRCRASASRRIRIARTCSSPTGSRDHRSGSFAAPTTASATHGGSIRSASWAFGTALRRTICRSRNVRSR